MEKEPGDWYGVNSIAQVLSDLFRERPSRVKKSTKLRNEVFNSLSVLTFADGEIYMNEIMDKIKEGFESQPEEVKQQMDGKDSAYILIDEPDIKEV